MQIQSPAFTPGDKIPQKYTCDGENISPPLEFINVPKNSKSLILICDDPDAPMGTWIHWVVFNINPRTRNVTENSVPQGGIEGVTSFGSKKYGGPCPPSGEHRYFFKLFALKEKLDLKSDATMSEIEKAIEGNLIEQAELMGVYERSGE